MLTSRSPSPPPHRAERPSLTTGQGLRTSPIPLTPTEDFRLDLAPTCTTPPSLGQNKKKKHDSSRAGVGGSRAALTLTSQGAQVGTTAGSQGGAPRCRQRPRHHADAASTLRPGDPVRREACQFLLGLVQKNPNKQKEIGPGFPAPLPSPHRARAGAGAMPGEASTALGKQGRKWWAGGGEA